MKPRDVALACCPPVLWAVAYTLAKPALAHFPPIFMMGLVYGLCALVLLRRSMRARTAVPALLAIAAFGGAIQSSLIFMGLAGLPASTSILVVQLQVPFAVLCAWIIGRERLDVRRGIAIAVAFVGVAVIAGAPEAVSALAAVALVVLGTASWGVSQALIRVHGRDDGRTITGALALYATPQLLLASLLLETGQIEATLTATISDWAAVVVLSLGGFVLAYSIWYGLLQRYRIDRVAPFALLMPFVGVLASVILLGEEMSIRALIGGAVVLAGLAVIVCAPRRKPASSERQALGAA